MVKALGEVRVLDGVTFTAPAGTVTGLLGPNGAGKTTTMRVLATLLRPDEGSVTLDGVDVAADPTEARRRLGLVTEEPGLYDRLTVREQLELAGRAYGLGATAVARRVDEVAELVRLTAELDKRAGVLSKGNRQKVSLCRAMVHDPPVLLLDEPTSGLDVVAAAGLEELLRGDELTGRRTVLLATHRVDEAVRLADDRVDALTDGAGGASFRDVVVRLLGEAALVDPGPQPG